MFVEALDLLWLDDLLRCRLDVSHLGWFDPDEAYALADRVGVLPAAVPDFLTVRALWAYHLGLVGAAVPAAAAGRLGDRERFRSELGAFRARRLTPGPAAVSSPGRSQRLGLSAGWGRG